MPSRSPRRREPSNRQTGVHKLLAAGLDHLTDGFIGRTEAKIPFHRLHCHDDIEISVNEHYPVVALFGGERVVLPPNCLVVFWAGRPHGPIETTPGGLAHGIHVPLPWVFRWQLPVALMQPLLAGRVFIDTASRSHAGDLDRLKAWVSLMQENTEETQRIVLLEAEARLRLLSLDLNRRAAPVIWEAQTVPSSRGVSRDRGPVARLVPPLAPSGLWAGSETLNWAGKCWFSREERS